MALVDRKRAAFGPPFSFQCDLTARRCLESTAANNRLPGSHLDPRARDAFYGDLAKLVRAGALWVGCARQLHPAPVRPDIGWRLDIYLFADQLVFQPSMKDVPLFRQAYDVVETHLDIFQDVFVRAIRQKQDNRREADIEIRSTSYRLDELALGFIAHFIMDEKLKHGAGRERDET